MTKQRGFPPGAGWIPLTVAIVVAVIVASINVIPQFRTQVVGSTGQRVADSGGATDNGGGGTDSSGGSAGGNTAPGSGGGSSGGPQARRIAGTKGQAGSGGTSGGGQAGVAGGTAGGAAAGGGAGGTSGGGGGTCAAGQNGGNTAPGVSASQIDIATTDVTTGVGSGFLGEATQGMQAAINEANSQGGICGRHIVLHSINDGWDGPTGETDIQNFINQGNVFALVGEPDSEGLEAAITSKTIDRAQIPVVGTDGMLSGQYYDPYVWPVAASTVSNMHIIAQYAHDKLGASSFGIVYDNKYKFGAEGAAAFDQEVKRLTGHGISGDGGGSGCNGAFCGVSSDSNDYSTQIKSLNDACQPCDVVVMLLEPGPMGTWMQGESGDTGWYKHLMGGEPLFDANMATNCRQDCNGMTVWTGYKPDIQPFDAQKPVYTFAQSLQSVCNTCDLKNEFTEGAYLGTKLFIAACQRVGANLTRDALQQALAQGGFDLGLTSTPLQFGTSFPRVANQSMTAYSDNASGSFNGWNFDNVGYINDPAANQDYAKPS